MERCRLSGGGDRDYFATKVSGICRATTSPRAVATPSAYTGDAATLERGQRLDARAWLLIRGWIKPVVKVPVADLDDPTPYWLLSTRNPDQLVRVLEEARQSSGEH